MHSSARRRFASASIPLRCAAALACALLVACGGGTAREGGRTRVVASTPLLAELAASVAGDDATVSALIPAAVDLHSYEPPPQAARLVAQADLLLVNGYRLEESLLDVIVQNRRSGTPIVAASEGIDPIAGSPARGKAAIGAAGDPHFWLDVANAVSYVERIRDALVQVDVAHAAGYRARAAGTVEALRALDAELRSQLAAIPPHRRKLVLFHDAFQYFARAYGFELVAAVLPASAAQQPSAADVARIVELVRRTGVPAVFQEPQFSGQVLELVARETGVRVLMLTDTYTDSAPSYAEMMPANARALVEGLR
ncbi:MAG: zinc ABC transporter substrate-binding protein [Dehalococcoidia bacterium]|nr:zinc ABC transporter substrate-binding protein [Dehalococcoidia bacterium]